MTRALRFLWTPRLWNLSRVNIEAAGLRHLCVVMPKLDLGVVVDDGGQGSVEVEDGRSVRDAARLERRPAAWNRLLGHSARFGSLAQRGTAHC